MSVRPGELLIDDSFADHDRIFDPTIDGEMKSRGYVERDYDVHPEGMFAQPDDMDLIDESEWDARYDEMVATKSFLSDIRLRGDNGKMIPSLDQNGKGYCWNHSPVSAVTMVRAVNKAPYVPLSGYAGACMMKNYRDEGGWCGLGAEYARLKGIPSQARWPQKSMSRSNDNPETWADALLYRITEDWVDLRKKVYDQNLTFKQLMTQLFRRIPCPVDFNWWSHSICALDPVRVEKGSWGIRIWNSWGDGWSDRGMGVLRGSKAIPNGALGVRVVGRAA